MIRIYTNKDEIPVGFLEAITKEQIDMRDVKYVFAPDYGEKCLDIVRRFNKYKTISLITECHIYVIFY